MVLYKRVNSISVQMTEEEEKAHLADQKRIQEKHKKIKEKKEAAVKNFCEKLGVTKEEFEFVLSLEELKN